MIVLLVDGIQAIKAVGSTTAPTAEPRWTVISMTRKNKLLEARAAISEGMERTAAQRDIWQNELVWWLCKAVLLLIEKEIKK